MKFIHLSDLHIGKRVNEFSMIEDQKDILEKILKIIDDENPDGVIIAGDVYDKSIPSTEAVELLDDFLVKLASRNSEIYIISGNHDSAERLAFGNRLIEKSGVHIAPVYNGETVKYSRVDEYGALNIYMLPFIKPINVRRYYPDEEITSYTDALRTVIERMGVDTDERNIIITHQFVTGAERSESEEISVGGSDNVDASVFAPFDYVALGHIHRPQNVGSEKIRYCGTPLKYSFSEANHQKSVTVVEFEEKGKMNIRTVPLIPLHDMVELRGKYDDLALRSFYEGTTYQEDYVHITLTDENDIPDAVNKLRTIYHNLMKLDYDNTRTRHSAEINGAADVEKKQPIDLFRELYELQNGQKMDREREEYITGLIEKIWED